MCVCMWETDIMRQKKRENLNARTKEILPSKLSIAGFLGWIDNFVSLCKFETHIDWEIVCMNKPYPFTHEKKFLTHFSSAVLLRSICFLSLWNQVKEHPLVVGKRKFCYHMSHNAADHSSGTSAQGKGTSAVSIFGCQQILWPRW